MIAIMFSVMIFLLILGFPMMIPVIVGPVLVLHFSFPTVDPQMLVQQMISGVRLMSLIAVPLFVFAAGIMTRGTTADRLIRLVLAFVQHYRGGPCIATNAACTLFGSISGSTQATVVAIGQPLLPRLKALGYSSSFSMALLINASDIALLIPPSIGMIVYGVVTGSSIGDLFIAGIVPGLLIFTCFSIFSYFYAGYMNIPSLEKVSWADRRQAMIDALPCLGFPVLILGGIYSGFFSPNEAAGMSILYALILEMGVYRSMTLRDLYAVALETGVVTAVVFILIGMGSAFSWLITLARIPDQILPAIFGVDPSVTYTLFVITLSYFVACMFIDNIVVIMVITPILFPIAKAAGIDPIVMGVIVTLQAAIGSATPPFGCDIFTAIAIFRRPYLEVVRATPPFTIILMAISALYIFFPNFALILR